jgi:thiol-disulfide isomerase/thioredoxin
VSDRRRFLATTAMAAAALQLGMTGVGRAQSITGGLPSLGGATAWLNSPPLTAAGLRGTVVLVEFWTYTCINWLRSLPYVRAWAERYRRHGLVVIGVHSPEFTSRETSTTCAEP